jgi:hypothetical protein
MEPTDANLPDGLAEVLAYAFGCSPVVLGDAGDPTTYTLMVLGDDGELYEWLASLSVDHRWTLSPRGLRYSSG